MKQKHFMGQRFIFLLLLLAFIFPPTSLAFFSSDISKVNGEQVSSAASANNDPDRTAYIKPWSDMTVDTNRIVVYPDHVEPSEILTFTFLFGNEGTQPIENVTVVCQPPNAIVPYINTTYVFWVGQDSAGPTEIDTPIFYPTDASTGTVLVDSIHWNVKSIPIKGTGKDTNKIVFKLRVNLKQVEISQDLMCWVGIFYSDKMDEKPITFKSVNIWAEVKPKLEIHKSVEKPFILPGESNKIFLRVKNNSIFATDHVIVQDRFWSSSGTIDQFIELIPDQIIPPADTDRLPTISWLNLELPETMTDYETITIGLQAKALNDLQSLFKGQQITINDFATIKLVGDTLFSAEASFTIIAPDLSGKLRPKLFNTYASPGFPVFLRACVHSSGATTVYGSPSYRIKIWLDDQKSTPFYDRVINTSISAGDSLCFSTESPPLSEGEHWLYFEVDYGNSVREINEFNNIYSIKIEARIHTLTTTVNRVTWADEYPIQNKPPGFPNPVFSYVMVTDQNYHYIPGLADSDQWSEPDQTMAIGATVRNIWNPVHEFHRENPDLPAQPDVFFQLQPPSVTRVADNLSDGFSVALVLDGNLTGTDRENADSALVKFIRGKRNEDKIALFKFGNQVSLVQNFTKNQNDLINAVKQTFSPGANHLLYDAVYNSITVTSNMPGRRAVLILTAGPNKGSAHGLNDIIQYADTSGVPVFTFGFGAADQSSLNTLARSTGGLNIYETNSDEMTYILSLYTEMLRNYYVFAHFSTDTTLDGTWRNVDITVNHPALALKSQDSGFFKAPNIGVDLLITIAADTDSFSVGGIDTVRYAKEGEQYSYTLKYENIGSLPGFNVTIRNRLPDSVDVVQSSFSRPPDQSENKNLFWFFDTIKAGHTGSITFDVIVKSEMPPWEVPLIDSAFVICAEDVYQQNNVFFDIVLVATESVAPPEIRATPDLVHQGETIQVEVRCFEPLINWDIIVTFEDNSTLETYADSFIIKNPKLLPGDWLLLPRFTDTKKRTENKQEKITFTLSGMNNYQQSFTASDFVINEAQLEIFLDRNAFRPENLENVFISFVLPRDLLVRTTIVNEAGELVNKLPEKMFAGGEKHTNVLSWDGRDEDGRKVGSGVYVVILEASSFKEWRKVIVIR